MCGDECRMAAFRCYAVTMRTRHLSHALYRHQYHIVWGTKYRYKYLHLEYTKELLKHVMYECVKKYPSLYIHALNTGPDHVHLQIEIPPNILVSKAVQKLKWHTSVALKKKFPFIKKMYLEGNIWSVGYFSSTIGLNEEMITRYIEYQAKHEKSKQVKLFS